VRRHAAGECDIFATQKPDEPVRALENVIIGPANSLYLDSNPSGV
jgi:hypothetical protein